MFDEIKLMALFLQAHAVVAAHIIMDATLEMFTVVILMIFMFNGQWSMVMFILLFMGLWLRGDEVKVLQAIRCTSGW
jgi:hypothetical protein